jgi:hypothetical protein
MVSPVTPALFGKQVEHFSYWWIEGHPSAAKARVDFATFSTRLKSCPFKTAPPNQFFRKL